MLKYLFYKPCITAKQEYKFLAELLRFRWEVIVFAHSVNGTIIEELCTFHTVEILFQPTINTNLMYIFYAYTLFNFECVLYVFGSLITCVDYYSPVLCLRVKERATPYSFISPFFILSRFLGHASGKFWVPSKSFVVLLAGCSVLQLFVAMSAVVG